MAKARSSEVDAYIFIRENLKELGWDTRSPARNLQGQVYTQTEIRTDLELKKFLGLKTPENIVKISESVLWIIEAKSDHSQLQQALDEAEEYAEKSERKQKRSSVIHSGLAGNQADTFLVQTRFLADKKFRPITINGKEVTSLISPQIAKTVLDDGYEINDLPVDEKLFLSKAEKINQYLHLGAINKNYRARVMAALLLALAEGTPPNIDAQPYILINDINSRAQHLLNVQGKSDFFEYIRIALPPTVDNHIKFKKALVQTIQELNNLNIRSAMNSGTDVLGKFYEVFLKYGNGAKEIGIVLTPRHITEFAVDVLGITNQDVVFDPTCGTGGFLVAAFDYIKRNSNKTQIERFRLNNLFGVEQEAEVVALALVNMIFRGDGKTHIIEGNCFAKNISQVSEGKAQYIKTTPEEQNLIVTKVLMNPPFALKNSDEKEYRFIDHALKQMQDNGLLFCVLPYSTMVKSGGYQSWRNNVLLKNNTLLSVVTLPPDLFYPVGVHTVAIIVKKGVPHPVEQPVLWVRATQDGFLKSKGKRLPSQKVKDDFSTVRNTLKAFIANQTMTVPNVDMFQKACPIDFGDALLELVAENYLDQAPPSETEVRKGIEQLIRDSVAFMIRSGREDAEE